MYFPQFLVGMFVTSFVVAIWADIETGSIWTALGWTILALIILQVGYFLLAFGLFYKRSPDHRAERGKAKDGRRWPTSLRAI